MADTVLKAGSVRLRWLLASITSSGVHKVLMAGRHVPSGGGRRQRRHGTLIDQFVIANVHRRVTALGRS